MSATPDAWVSFTVAGNALTQTGAHKAKIVRTLAGKYTITLDEPMDSTRCRVHIQVYDASNALVMKNLEHSSDDVTKILYTATATAALADITQGLVSFDRTSV